MCTNLSHSAALVKLYGISALQCVFKKMNLQPYGYFRFILAECSSWKMVETVIIKKSEFLRPRLTVPFFIDY